MLRMNILLNSINNLLNFKKIINNCYVFFIRNDRSLYICVIFTFVELHNRNFIILESCMTNSQSKFSLPNFLGSKNKHIGHVRITCINNVRLIYR